MKKKWNYIFPVLEILPSSLNLYDSSCWQQPVSAKKEGMIKWSHLLSDILSSKPCVRFCHVFMSQTVYGSTKAYIAFWEITWGKPVFSLHPRPLEGRWPRHCWGWGCEEEAGCVEEKMIPSFSEKKEEIFRFKTGLKFIQYIKFPYSHDKIS